MTREIFIEQTLRAVYGEQPGDDASITVGLVNTYIEPAVGYAASKCYEGSIRMDGVAYVNNSFYTTFSALPLAFDSDFRYRTTLPHAPMGLGRNEGVELTLRDARGHGSRAGIPMSASQRSVYKNARQISGEVLFYAEGNYLYVLSALDLTPYTCEVTMVSAGDPTNLSQELHVPPDDVPVMQEYIRQQLLQERATPKDNTNDGEDN